MWGDSELDVLYRWTYWSYIGILIMQYIVLAGFVLLAVFCLLAGLNARRKEKLAQEAQEIENMNPNKVVPNDVEELEDESIMTSGLISISPNKIAEAAGGTIMPVLDNEQDKLSAKYDLLVKMYLKLRAYLKNNHIAIPQEFEEFTPADMVNVESYPYVDPEMVTVAPPKPAVEAAPVSVTPTPVDEDIPVAVPRSVVAEKVDLESEAVEEAAEEIKKIEDKAAEVVEKVTKPANEFDLEYSNKRIVFPADLIKKLRLSGEEKVWTIIHNGVIKLGKGDIPYKKYDAGRSYKTDAAGQVKMGEKVFVDLGLNPESLTANIKRGVISVSQV